MFITTGIFGLLNKSCTIKWQYGLGNTSHPCCIIVPSALCPNKGLSFFTPPVQHYPGFFQYPKHGTPAPEAAGFPYLIDKVPTFIHIHHTLFPPDAVIIHRGQCSHAAFHLSDCIRGFADIKCFFGQQCHDIEYIRHLCLWKKLVAGVYAVMDRYEPDFLQTAIFKEIRKLPCLTDDIAQFGNNQFIPFI